MKLYPPEGHQHFNSTEESIANSTKEILNKIAEINKNQGLLQPKPSIEAVKLHLKDSEKEVRRYDDFKFSQNPFNNPIIDYINKNKQNTSLNRTESAAEKAEEDEIPDHFIKRKVTHQQTLIVPGLSQPVGSPLYIAYAQDIYPFSEGSYPSIGLPSIQNSASKMTNQNVPNPETVDVMETQTVDNIKTILLNSHAVPGQAFNPFASILPLTMTQYFNPYERRDGASNIPPATNIQWLRRPSTKQQIQWPWTQYFPIIIKDPFVQMFNAFTSMVEYGPTANCTKETKDKGRDVPLESMPVAQSRSAKALQDVKKGIPQLNFNIKNPSQNPEITIFGVENASAPKDNANLTVLDIEDLKITNDPVQFTFNFKTPAYSFGDRQSRITKGETKRVAIKRGEIRQSPPLRDQQPGEDELESEMEAGEFIMDSEIKKDDGTQHNQNKKFFSKDNTGSGIFIHKIKVRKGGVAIAGPGGIATAGSGGTAIVGPNGYAYTHPDSLAIAGTGSKVIAIDPSVSLSDVVNNQNKTRRDGSTPRMGRVVAVGPVIYYNRG